MRFHRGHTRRATPSSNGTRAPASRTVARNIDDVVRIENADRERLGWSDHVADTITAFGGSMTYVWLHVVWFAVWIALNVGVFGLAAFDEFPFGLLTMIVSLEAIFLSTFVLISQNREAAQADRRARLDLQINMLAEQEITHLAKMVAEIQKHLGIEHADDDETEEVLTPISVEELAQAVDVAEGDG